MESHGRHSGQAHTHTVEGTDPQLHVETYEPAGAVAGAASADVEASGAVDAAAKATRPVLLIHGFASSIKLNWADAGWISALTGAGRRIIAVDLPGHGLSGAPEDMDSYTPSRIRADLLQIVFDAGARPLQQGDPASGLDVIGYSLGSRLAWEFGATQAELVHRMVLGGPGVLDPLAAFDLPAAQRYLADGTPIADESTAGLLKMAQLLPSNNVFALLSLVEAIKTEPFVPDEAVPRMPVLLVAGDKDERAETMPQLAALLDHAEQLLLPARTHTNAITSRAFKNAALDFLAGSGPLAG
ncbi:MAG TPA: alpha/beta fold hydrolase [Micrococcaceae bacterium]|jgi:pimeloyl-ACP methyl ester carboxylesterase|nr:alpha/beta fold hydrolase [Micrococcaceae bacterium]